MRYPEFVGVEGRIRKSIGEGADPAGVVQVDVRDEHVPDFLGRDSRVSYPRQEGLAARRRAGFDQRPAVLLGKEIRGDQTFRIPEIDIDELAALAEFQNAGAGHGTPRSDLKDGVTVVEEGCIA